GQLAGSREKENVGICVENRAVCRQTHQERELLAGRMSGEIRLHRIWQSRRQRGRGCLDTNSVVDLFEQFNASACVRSVRNDDELFRSASVSEKGANGCDLLRQSVFSRISKNTKREFARNANSSPDNRWQCSAIKRARNFSLKARRMVRQVHPMAGAKLRKPRQLSTKLRSKLGTAEIRLKVRTPATL